MAQKFENPFLNLNYEPALENLGDDYSDIVSAAEFPEYILRFRNDQLLPHLGLKKEQVRDDHFIEAFGHFSSPRNFLALRYHGYQFGEYNPYLGDGRGFIYGQIKGQDNNLYDFGTKGSGRTPYSRNADGRLTLKGGVREVLAAEALHYLGVKTSRCLSLIETGEDLWRGDEPSPTRSSVMIRFSLSHIRFGTFERLHYIQRPDLIRKLLDHVINYYYPEVIAEQFYHEEDRYLKFYESLVYRVAKLAAQWMSAGFCHGVLNTDNMSITGESFDYGPYAFIVNYDPKFTAAYFDYGGRYSYGNQPFICRFNLEMLQIPLKMVASRRELENILIQFDSIYQKNYKELMLYKLGFKELSFFESEELLKLTIQVLRESGIIYPHFFAELAQGFNLAWRKDESTILENAYFIDDLNKLGEIWLKWKHLYYKILNNYPESELTIIQERLAYFNPKTALLRPIIEEVWEAISQDNNWQPFYNLITNLQNKN
jgi:serine/tyrosine/threonine adenylyltransferase